MKPNQQNIEAPSDKVTWLANQIFSAFPKECTGLKLFNLDCGCIYYQRLFRDGEPDTETGIYRDGEDGPCDVCMFHEENWKDRVIDEVTVYSTKILNQSS